MIKAGKRISLDDLLLAMPTGAGQLTANDLSKYTRLTAVRAIPALAPVLDDAVERVNVREKVTKIVDDVRELLLQSRAVIPSKMDCEISHHYGLDRFEQFGAVILTCVNREYCKKLIAMLPGQQHPEQYHLKKEETFLLLYGDMTLGIDGKERTLKAGDVVTVERGQRHWMTTQDGCVLDEISSTHYKDDSFYTDPSVNQNADRKTWLTHWME